VQYGANGELEAKRSWLVEYKASMVDQICISPLQNRLDSTVLMNVSHSNLKITKFFELRLDKHVGDS
jgi:hypothetical protein